MLQNFTGEQLRESGYSGLQKIIKEAGTLQKP
jgi:hypothetical protein